MYGGPLHNVGFIQRILAQLSTVDREIYPTKDRIEGMLHTALEEMTFGAQSKNSDSTKTEQLDALIPKTDPAELDHHPFFFIPSSVAKIIHCQAPPTAAIRGALKQAGFKVTMSHCKPGSIRTDAPWTAIWHVMLEWVRQKAPLKNKLKDGTPGYHIMSKATAHQVKDSDAAVESTVDNSEVFATAREENQEGGSVSVEVKKEDARPSYLGTDFEVVFNEKLGRDADRGKYVRFQLAPRENWGPMARAK